MRRVERWFLGMAVFCALGAAVTVVAGGMQNSFAYMVVLDLTSGLRQEGRMSVDAWESLCQELPRPLKHVIQGPNFALVALWTGLSVWNLVGFFAFRAQRLRGPSVAADA